MKDNKDGFILLLDTFQAACRNGFPVRGILLALLKELDEELSCLLAMVWINVETRLPVNNDLSWTAMVSGKRGQTTGHGFDDSQAKGLIESRLHECSFGVTDVPVELTIPHTVHLGRDPSELAIQVVCLYELVHLLHLGLLFNILGFLPPVSPDHDKIHQFPKLWALGVPFDKSC